MGREAWFSCICSSNFFSAFCSFRFIFVRGSRSEGSWGLPHWKKWCNFPSKCGNLWGYLWVFQKKMVLPLLPPKQPKMIIFSKENLWLLGKPTILGNPPKHLMFFSLLRMILFSPTLWTRLRGRNPKIRNWLKHPNTELELARRGFLLPFFGKPFFFG